MNYSQQQQQVIETGLAGKSVASPACAGAGKSSTFRPLLNQLANRGETCVSIPFMVSLYNEELAAMPQVDVLNAHKRGYRMVGGRFQVEEKKVWKIASEINGEKASQIAELVEKLKSESYGVNPDVSADFVADKYTLEPELIGDALLTLSISDRRRDVLDYSDMLRFPTMDKKNCPVKGNILIDEAQDYSPLMCDFLKLFIGPNTKGFISGDPERQALQQFAGADPNTFNILAEMLGCEIIPLTYNFRCGKSIVDNANEYYPSDMEAAPENPNGEVTTTTTSEMVDLDENSAILCEMNSPLLSLVIDRMSKDLPTQFRPGKLWDKIKGLMWGLYDTRNFPVGMIASRAEEKLQDYAGENGPSPEQLESLKCLQIIEQACLTKGILQTKWQFGKYKKTPIHPFQQLLEEISKGNSGPFAMTGHTSKGLQWRDVYHLPKQPAPRPNKTPKPWESHQWRCVGYVLRTRAIKRHITVEG